jgi:hypothetical protein
MSVERKDETANNLGFPNTMYGVIESEALAYKGSEVGTGSGQKGEYVVEYIFDLADLPSDFNSESDKSLTTLPVGAIITKAELQVLETVSGGTDLDIGIISPDGNSVDDTGLFDAYTGTVTSSFAEGDGAFIGVVMPTKAQISVGGTRTAGKIKLTVTYKITDAI